MAEIVDQQDLMKKIRSIVLIHQIKISIKIRNCLKIKTLKAKRRRRKIRLILITRI